MDELICFIEYWEESLPFLLIYIKLFVEQVNLEIVGQSSSSQTTEFSSVVDGSMWPSDGVEPVPETVTVTLTQKPGDGTYLRASLNQALFISEFYQIQIIIIEDRYLINQERLDITLSHYPGDGRNLRAFFLGDCDCMCIPITVIMDYWWIIRFHRGLFFRGICGNPSPTN